MAVACVYTVPPGGQEPRWLMQPGTDVLISLHFVTLHGRLWPVAV